MSTTHRFAWVYPGVQREKKYYKHRYMTSYSTEWTRYYLRDARALVQAWKDENYWRAISNAEEDYQFRLKGSYFAEWVGRIDLYTRTVLPSDRQYLKLQNERFDNLEKIKQDLINQITQCEKSTRELNEEKDRLLSECNQLTRDIKNLQAAIYSLIPAISYEDTHVSI